MKTPKIVIRLRGIFDRADPLGTNPIAVLPTRTTHHPKRTGD